MRGKLKMKYVPKESLRADPHNKEIFLPLGKNQMEALKASIAEHDLINPITVTKDMLIIAGEQRWQAAMQLDRITEVPVIIRDPKDEMEIRELRNHENLRRRNLQPTEVAAATEELAKIKRKRLEEEYLAGPNSSKQSHQKVTDIEVDTAVGADLGVDQKTVWARRQLTKLLPELGNLLNKREIRRDTAGLLARLSETEQHQFLTDFTPYLNGLTEAQAQANHDKLREIEKERDKWHEEWRRAQGEAKSLLKTQADINSNIDRKAAARAEQLAEEDRKELDKTYRAALRLVRGTDSGKLFDNIKRLMREFQHDGVQCADSIPLDPDLFAEEFEEIGTEAAEFFKVFTRRISELRRQHNRKNSPLKEVGHGKNR
jgi:ParB-like chromosome segregation protein Spo0J